MKTSDESGNTADAAALPRISVSEVRARWGKLTDRELAAIKGRGDLVRRVQAKYGLDRQQAQTNVDVWAAGRRFPSEKAD